MSDDDSLLNGSTPFEVVKKQINNVENGICAEVADVKRKLKNNQANSNEDGDETPKVNRRSGSFQITDQTTLNGIAGIISCIFLMIIGAYVKQLDPLLRWTTLFIAPIWHTVSCIVLLFGNCSLNHQRFVMRYIYMNAISCVGMACFGFAMLCIAWSEDSPTLYVFFAAIHFGFFAFTCLAIFAIMRAD
ncbi:hypothetical protein M3Y97_00847200 [Aphelenchoides bicaudatus]|nr:hypothetical protein M3Y97_00847200 [Aphelenchoides bicaudatus]